MTGPFERKTGWTEQPNEFPPVLRSECGPIAKLGFYGSVDSVGDILSCSVRDNDVEEVVKGFLRVSMARRVIRGFELRADSNDLSLGRPEPSLVANSSVSMPWLTP